VHAPVPERGAVVWIRQHRWRVEYARRVGDIVRLDPVPPERRLTFLSPCDRPGAASARRRARRVRRQQAVARLATLCARRESTRAVLAAIDARMDILAYQLEPVAAVIAGARRVLIADEVGLGKTIQAGLVLAELQRRRPSLRALVIVPAALRAQWQQELDAKFGLRAELADRAALDTAVQRGRFGDNPWARPGVWLASVDYLRQPHVRDALPFDAWDVVIVDEAHATSGDSDRHQVCQDAARRARHVLLLTATPHSGDDSRFARLLDLGALPDTPDPLTVFRRTRAQFARGAGRRVHWRPIACSHIEARVFDVLLAFERALLRGAGVHRDQALLLLCLFRKRALSSMHALAVSLDRRLSWIDRADRHEPLDWLQPSLLFDPDAPADDADDETTGLTATVGMGANHERTWLRRLRLLTGQAARDDSRLARLVRMTSRTDAPLVIFTEFRHSLDAVRIRLQRHRAVVALHGGMTTAERAAALEAFLSGHASVLVATDVAGQGLNLQHRARWIVNLELPWSPSRLEQRIGRVDRIGQTRRVHATIFTSSHAAEARVLRRLAERALDARRAVGDAVFEGVAPPGERAIAAAVLADADDVERPPLRSRALVVSSEWRRRAAAVAADVSRRRILARHWRASSPGPSGGRVAYSGRAAARAVAFVCSIPIFDAAGAVIERQLIAVRAPIAEGASVVADTGAVASAVRAAAARRLAARVRRLTRDAVHAAVVHGRVERAIERYLASVEYPETQPGLFDRTVVRRLEAHAGTVVELARDRETREREWDDAARLSIGEPVVEMVVGLRT
jgi:superfamily II DNA or RNA helicase